MPGHLSDEMRLALRQMELGTPLRSAFEELRQRNESESLASFVTAILQAEELGAPLARALTEISVDMRRDAIQHARRRAQRADPQITLIVTFLMLPAMMLLIVAMLWFGTDGSFGDVFG
jgi:tight adherence protein C